VAIAVALQPVRAGIYARISSDREADGLAVARQLADCRRLAERKGWPVVEEYVDDDVSAWSGRERPEYARMLADLEAGAINALLVYDLDRLHRQLSGLEELIGLCEAQGLTNVASVSGDLDLTTPDGRFRARILVAVATKESDDKSRRVARKHDELAESGKWSGGGSRPFGFEPGGMKLRRSEAVVVRECARRFLAGEPIRSICNDLNKRGIPAASGGQWTIPSLRRMLASGRIAGLREHHGQIVAKAEWPAIITPEQSETIRATLADPARRTNRSARRYLLAGLVRCGLCGSAMVARPRAGGQRRYACVKDNGGCGRITINAEPLEQLLTEACLYRLDSPELAAALNGQASEAPDAARFRSEVEDAQAQLAELGEAYANKQIGMPELIAARKLIEARLDSARRQLAKLTRSNALSEHIGQADSLRQRWESLDLTRQHAIIEAILERVTIAPARPGYNRFDENRATPTWRA
jgi:DNA invertase Pin-like site-specific DNA recombinase